MWRDILFEIFLVGVTGVSTITFFKYILQIPKVQKYFKKTLIFHPNSLSILRIPLAMLALYLYWKNFIIWALFLYTLSIVLDALDGMIARSCQLETQLGKWLDPFSDKIVYFIPLVFFWAVWKINLYGVLLFIVIDTFGQFSRIILDYFRMETKANIFGKAKTVFIFVWILFLMMVERKTNSYWSFEIYALWIAVILALSSIIFKFIPTAFISKKGS